MRNDFIKSIRTKSFLFFLFIFFIMSFSVIMGVNFQVKKIINNAQVYIYNEKIDIILKSLKARYSLLMQTQRIEAYEDEFKDHFIKNFIKQYYIVEEKSFPFILNKNGVLLCKPHYIDTRIFLKYNYIVKILNKKNGNFDYYLNGKSRWIIFKYFKEWDWIVGYSMPLSLKYRELYLIRNVLIVITLTISLLSLFIIFIVSSNIISKIIKLKDASVKISHGELDYPIDINDNNEIGMLARSFSSMKDAIKDKIEVLNKKNEELNHEINERKKVEEALRESEEKFRTIAEQSLLGILIIQDKNIKFFNNAILDIVSLTKHNFMKKKYEDFKFFIHKDDRDFVLDQLSKKLLKDKYVISNYSFRLLFNNKLKWIDLYSNNITYNGKSALLIMLVDSTDRIETHKKLEILNDKLEEKNKELEQVIYITSHDLRSPLINVEGFSNELEHSIKEFQNILSGNKKIDSIKRRIDKIYKQDILFSLKYIHSSINKMDQLLSGLLKVSRAGRNELKLEKINMNHMIKDVLDSFEFIIQAKNIEIKIKKLPSCIGDKMLLYQVFSNLIDNAIKYLDDKRKGFIGISGYYNNEGKNIYIIEDNGIGISDKNTDKIFQIFYRIDPDKIEGQGLGMTIVKKIIDKHNGDINVESQLNKGSKFTISLSSSYN